MEINYKKTPFTRGLTKIDKGFGKPDYNELIVLFWYFSSGKTEFTYFMARNNVRALQRVCYISLELPEYNMKLRIARKSAGIKKYDFQIWNYNEEQKMIMEDTFQEINKLEHLYIIKPPINDLQNIEKTIRQYYDKWCRLFIIDNLDKIIWNEIDNVRYQQISSTLQDIKNENNICIVLIHHAKKPSSRQFQYQPAGMSWSRGSQKILDNATQTIEIRRDLDPDLLDKKEKSRVYLYQYKDMAEGNNNCVEIYFHKWIYNEEYQNDIF